jgi:archaellum component FlaF (FlaF/FlaG flagellin family)
MIRFSFKLFILFLLAGLPILGASAVPDQVVINSADWQDVYLGAHYAGFNNIKSNFLISSEHAPVLLQTLEKYKNNVLLIESDKAPFAFSYKTVLEGAGFTVDEIISSGTALNIELAKRSNASDFIIVDDSYGYNAISVAPYAAQEKFFVVFANKENIDELYPFLITNGVGRMIIYGYSDFEVKTRLAVFNPEIINNGSRFDNNIELLKKYDGVQQVFLTNGEFIEEGIMSGKQPVLFPGRERVPSQVVEYIKSSGIKTGVVIGNELAGVAHQLKQSTNMFVFLKIGQGLASGGSSEVRALDMFPIPIYDLAIDINSVKYNRATKELEVTYENLGHIGVYLSSTIEILSSGARITTIGDRESVYVDSDSTLTVAYKTELSGEKLIAKFTTMFGEVPGSFERVIYKEMNIEMIEILDNSLLNISKVSYDKAAHKIKVKITNIGQVNTYSKTQIKFLVYGEDRIMVQDKPMLLEPGASMDAVFITTLSDTNIEENPMINVRVNYGQRDSALIKIIEGNYPLGIVGDYTILIVAVLIIVIIIFWIQKKKKQKKDMEKSKADSMAVLDSTESISIPESTEGTAVPESIVSTAAPGTTKTTAEYNDKDKTKNT